MVLGFIKLQRLPTLFSKYTSFETTTCRQNKEIHWFNFCSCKDNAKKYAFYQINITKILSSFISWCKWSQKLMPIFQTIRFPNTIEIHEKKNKCNWAYDILKLLCRSSATTKSKRVNYFSNSSFNRMVPSSIHWAQGLGKLFLQLIQVVRQNRTPERRIRIWTGRRHKYTLKTTNNIC